MSIKRLPKRCTRRGKPGGGHASVLGATGLLAGAATIAAAAAIITASASVHRVASGAGRVTVAGLELSYPAINAPAAVSLALAGLGCAAIIRAIRAVWRQRRAHRRFLSSVRVVGELAGHPGVRVIAGHRPEAFCAGFRRPVVYVSEGAVHALTPAELRVVLEHERDHQRAGDPLRIACGRVLARAVFFVPLLTHLHDRYVELVEVRADAAAVRTGAVRALASALLVFQDAARGGGGVSPARVDALVGEPDCWRVPTRPLAASIATLAAGAAGVWWASASASVKATLNTPLVNAQPCAVLLLGALAALALAATRLPWSTLRSAASRTLPGNLHDLLPPRSPLPDRIDPGARRPLQLR